jgi:tetrapyrrole methylase family protein/MazG family protein
MKELNRLLSIADRLLSPGGCPWDLEQTFFSLQPHLLEEMYEFLEAIDLLDSEKMKEELGDVLYSLIFIAKLAEKEGRFSFQEAIEDLSDKLVRRHPHVFGNTQVSDTDEVVKNWEKIKSQEKGKETRKGLFDGIPPGLPSLPKAQKMARKIRKSKGRSSASSEVHSEEDLGAKLWALIEGAEEKGMDAESALRRHLEKIKAGEEFRHEGHS